MHKNYKDKFNQDSHIIIRSNNKIMIILHIKKKKNLRKKEINKHMLNY